MEEVIIVRHKDHYDITLTNGKTMSISLAEDDRYVLGVSHKRLKRMPDYFNHNDIPALLMSFAFGYYTERYEKKVREYADRLISLPNYSYEVKNYVFKDIADQCAHSYNADIDWKFYINALKDIYSKPKLRERFEEEMRSCFRKDFSSTYAAIVFNIEDDYSNSYIQYLKDHGYHKSPDFIKCSKVKAFREGVKGILKREEEKQKLCDSLKKAISDFCGGMDYYEASSLIGLSVFVREYISDKIETLTQYCLSCLELKKQLGIDYQFTNIERDYQKLFIMANKNAWVDDNVYFGEKQSQAYDKLHFENKKFETFVPTTREELAEYGFAFNNCLNKWEWENRLRYDNYYCVIVLSKETKEPLVCVDIKKHSNSPWTVDQYYGKSNTNITNKDLLAFKEAFQKHLEGE